MNNENPLLMKKHFSLSKTIHFSEAVDSAILDWEKISEGKYHVRMCLSVLAAYWVGKLPIIFCRNKE